MMTRKQMRAAEKAAKARREAEEQAKKNRLAEEEETEIEDEFHGMEEVGDLTPPPFPDDPGLDISSSDSAASDEAAETDESAEAEEAKDAEGTSESEDSTPAPTEPEAAESEVSEASKPETEAAAPTKEPAEPKAQPAQSQCAYPEIGVFFEVKDPNAKAGWTIQSVWDFTDNVRQFMTNNGILGSVESYIRSEISSRGIRLVAKYLDRDTHPVDKPAVPAPVAKALIGDYCRRLAKTDSRPAVTPINVLFANLSPEKFNEALEQLSDAEKKAIIAKMQQSMQAEWHNPYADDSPADPPTQP